MITVSTFIVLLSINFLPRNHILLQDSCGTMKVSMVPSRCKARTSGGFEETGGALTAPGHQVPVTSCSPPWISGYQSHKATPQSPPQVDEEKNVTCG